MRNRSVILALALLAATGGVARAQVDVRQIPSDNTAYGTTSAEFLTFAPNARGAALGDAFAALATDISALFYNPAGLSQMTSSEMQLSTTSYIADTRYTWAGVAFPFGGGARAVGVQVGSFGFSGQPVYTVDDPTGASELTYSVAETFIGLSFSQQFSDRFSARHHRQVHQRQAGRRQRERLRHRLRHQLPRQHRRAADPRRVHDPEPGHQPEPRRQRAGRADHSW